MIPVERVSIQVSDPWEIVSEVGAEPMTGRLQQPTSTTAVVRLDVPLRVRGKSTRLVRVMPRHATGDLMKEHGPVAVNLIFLNDDEIPAFAAIGTLTKPQAA